MPSPFSSLVASFLSFIPGSRLVDGGDVLGLAQAVVGVNTPVVAKAGGGVAGTPVRLGMTKISTVASGADSILLPPAVPGSTVSLNNAGANSAQIFGQQANQGGLAAGDQIVVNNSSTPAAVATGVAQAANVDAEYKCYELGIWKQSVSA